MSTSDLKKCEDCNSAIATTVYWPTTEQLKEVGAKVKAALPVGKGSLKSFARVLKLSPFNPAWICEACHHKREVAK